MNLLDKLCKELGVKIGEKWLANDGNDYKISSCGYLRRIVYVDNIEEASFEYMDNISKLLTRELKPVWEPRVGETYYSPFIYRKEEERYLQYVWEVEHKTDKFLWDNNLVFRTKEEAIAAANKMIKALKGEK